MIFRIRLHHLRPQTRKKNIFKHCIIEWAISVGISVIFIASAKFNCRFKMSQSNWATIDWTPKPIQYGCLNLGWKCNKSVYLLFKVLLDFFLFMKTFTSFDRKLCQIASTPSSSPTKCSAIIFHTKTKHIQAFFLSNQNKQQIRPLGFSRKFYDTVNI